MKDRKELEVGGGVMVRREAGQKRCPVKLHLNWQRKEPGSTLPCWDSLAAQGKGCLLTLSAG